MTFYITDSIKQSFVKEPTNLDFLSICPSREGKWGRIEHASLICPSSLANKISVVEKIVGDNVPYQRLVRLHFP